MPLLHQRRGLDTQQRTRIAWITMTTRPVVTWLGGRTGSSGDWQLRCSRTPGIVGWQIAQNARRSDVSRQVSGGWLLPLVRRSFRNYWERATAEYFFEKVVGLPANLAIAAVAISADAIVLVRIQLQLVANLGRVYGVPLDPDDPEDILKILAFALGGSVADRTSADDRHTKCHESVCLQVEEALKPEAVVLLRRA